MRLDMYLVETGHFSTRTKAKKAIKDGFVRLDGLIVSKPSKRVNNADKIVVESGHDKPKGYFKLSYIQSHTNVLRSNDHVLDIGSSAGGFLLFSSEIVDHVQGIEYSLSFKEELDELVSIYDNISVIYGDIFSIHLTEFGDKKFDVILNDLTLDPQDSVTALSRVIPMLRENGRLIQVLKTETFNEIEPISEKLQELGFRIKKKIGSTKKEIYLYCVLDA
ncbi:S4 domain-containing protein [Methanosalsum natronophilum]|uniref:Methyltransferase domain-containing protein n=1 Tax=Methanosalsum natronophilum TaxID=768733 RepID=A0A424YS59_9EURY|nr:S4 domain-containing protein [Methanosalsum natronophilum]MCS3923264.1 23S rRNA (cytidine1920-2'-O)/16S rRNA (cytidine1409-2'-O)-methyltransferase [Methanosalsum natronophilum]RQD81866.1 MAG: methyltransferase domain-containing protein [Methanosalsum natronophilum]